MNAPVFLFSPSAHLTALPRRLAAGLLLLTVALAAVLPTAASAQLYTETRILFGDPNPAEYFGYDLAATRDTIVVSTSSNRRIYVFVRNGAGWTLQQKLTPNYSAYSYGQVAIDGDTLVAGGIIYTRAGGAWTEQASLPYPDPQAAVQGDTVAVGDPYNPSNPSQGADGSVFVYTRSGTTWTEQAHLLPDAGQAEHMGTDVVLDGNTLIAGLRSGPGGAYVFVRSGATWTRQARLVTPTGNGWMRVAIEGDTAAVSDPGNNRIYIFTRAGTTWTLTQTLNLPGTGGNYLGDELSMNGGILAAGADGWFYLFSKTPSGWILAQSLRRDRYAFGDVALADRGKLFVFSNPFDNRQTDAGGIVEAFYTPPPAPAGSGWRDIDVGAVGIAGSSTDSGATIAVRGSGADIWENSDQFHYRTESLTGDGAIIARVNSAGSGHPWAKAGLMFREDIAPSSRTVMALVTPGSPVGLQARRATADTTGFQEAGWLGAPIWFMLARSGDLFAAYRSSDGNTWTAIGSSTISMPQTIHVGLAVSSHDNAALNTGTFSSVEIVRTEPPGAPNPPSNLTGSLAGGTSVQLQWTDNSSDETGFSVQRSAGNGGGTYETIGEVGANITTYTDSGLPGNTTYTYRVRAAHNTALSAPSNTFTITTSGPPPATLTGSDLGTVVVPGTFTNSSGTLTIDAAGADLWNDSDNGYFIHREITGDFDLRARVTSLTNTHPWAKAGVMVRESLDPRSRNLFTMISGDAASGFQVRDTFGASTAFTEGRWVHAPYWVRLVRTGNTFQSLTSEDGVTWQTVGTRTLALPATLRAGVAVSSHVANTTTHATVTSLSFGN